MEGDTSGAAAPDPVVAHFDARPAAYDRQLGRERRSLRVAAAFAGDLEGRDVIDLGAGTGALTAALLAGRGTPASVVAVDAAPRMLARAGDRLGDAVTLLRADARAVPSPGGSADVVTCAYLLHLLAPADGAAVVAEAWRLLRPGGLLVVVVHGSPPGPAGTVHRAVWRAWRRIAPGAGVVGGGPLADVRPLLTGAGFVVEASRRVAGVYWGQVVRCRRPAGDLANRWRP